MSLLLDDFLITGRTFAEYAAFFDLKISDLEGRHVLDCPSGASSFIAEAKRHGIKAQGCDLLYRFGIEEIRQQGEKSIELIYKNGMDWARENSFSFYGSMQRHREFREDALQGFCEDFNEREYRFAQLPELPYEAKQFDLVFSSHLLFVYDDRLDYDFHAAAVESMLRVGREVRLFPLVDYKNSRVDETMHLSPLAYKIAEDFSAEIIKTDFEFQKKGGYMMRIR